MKGIFKILSTIINGCLFILKSKYKWILLFFVLWILRVSCIPADAGGIAKGLQIITTFGLLYYAVKLRKSSISNALFKTKSPNVTLTWYLLLGLISTLWSYVPMMSFFMAFEKLSFIVVLYVIFSQFYTFQSTERLFILFMVGILILNGTVTRIMGHQGFIGHDLQQGSCAAMCFSYCCGEYLAKKTHEKERYTMLRGGILISIFFLIVSTSGGANASAAFGFGVALLVCGKFGWGILLIIFGILIYFFKELGEDIFKFLMAGKSEGDIKSSTGRTSIWKVVEELGKQKPMLGWGYAAMERYITDKGYMPLTDLHSNFYGAYGNLGIIGLSLLIFHHISAIFYTLYRAMKPGYVGLLCAICCGTLNGYSYGFLTGKTALISVVYLAVLMMAYIYSKVRYK
mgnify:CR=1 FL=1|jgi:uncharacterized integral membrane protein